MILRIKLDSSLTRRPATATLLSCNDHGVGILRRNDNRGFRRLSIAGNNSAANHFQNKKSLPISHGRHKQLNPQLKRQYFSSNLTPLSCSTTSSPFTLHQTLQEQRHCQQLRIVYFSSSSSSQNKQDDDDDDQTDKQERSTAELKSQSTVNNQKNEWYSLPNIITMSRILGTPIIGYWIIHNQMDYALIGCTLAAISDYADGYLAKNCNMKTILGSYLDPLADKFFVNTLAVSLWYVQCLPTYTISIWLGKDVILIMGTGWYLYQTRGSVNFISLSTTTTTPTAAAGKDNTAIDDDALDSTERLSPSTAAASTKIDSPNLQVQPTIIGKVNTALQFITLGIAMYTQIKMPGSGFEFLQTEGVTSIISDIGGSSSAVGEMTTTDNVNNEGSDNLNNLLQGMCMITSGTTIASMISYTGNAAWKKEND